MQRLSPTIVRGIPYTMAVVDVINSHRNNNLYIHLIPESLPGKECGNLFGVILEATYFKPFIIV